METARLQLQGIYSLLAGLVLLLVVPIYQMAILGPAGYQAAATIAFNQGDYGPLLVWISNHGSLFVIYRFLELIAFLLAIRLPLALHRTFRAYGRVLVRRMVVGGIAGFGIFAAMIAVSTFSFVNAASQYGGQAPASAAARDILANFTTAYFAEGLGQNTLGGALITTFLVCASLLIVRSGKLPGLLVFFGLLVAALMAALAILFAISAPAAQTLPTPAILSFAIWLIWLGILLIRRARRLLEAHGTTTTPTAAQGEASLTADESAGQLDAGEVRAAEVQTLAAPANEPEQSDRP